MKRKLLAVIFVSILIPVCVGAKESHSDAHNQVSKKVIDHQRHMLSENTKGKGYGPQSPRDIDSRQGKNKRIFGTAPAYTKMNLCNIHFHKNAEHKGGEFTKYAGPGDGHGYESGYKFSGHLRAAEMKPVKTKICPSEHGSLYAGDTIEVHYVYSTAQIKPGPTLGSCLNESIHNPQLRVEAQVYVLVNNKNALDFGKLTKYVVRNGLHQGVNIPSNTGKPIQYAGSTTGPGYNEKGSPFQVTWSVRPRIAKVDIETVGKWCEGNTFKEDHAHGVRNLVGNPDLLSKIGK